jgi:hypothetical protein
MESAWRLKKIFSLRPYLGVYGKCFRVKCLDQSMSNVQLTSTLYEALLGHNQIARDVTITIHKEEEMKPRCEIRLVANTGTNEFHSQCTPAILDMLRYQVTEVYITIWNRSLSHLDP